MDRPLALVVDDEPHIRYILELKLTQAGWCVRTARDGRRAYEQACAEPPRVVVADLQMPILDGLALCRLLKENPLTCAIPVVMLTARGHRISSEQLAQTNVKAVIGKPFSPRELLDRVAQLAGHAGAGCRPGDEPQHGAAAA
jgi:two-component system alkaline phosphatase synthesis response regulator PhoP